MKALAVLGLIAGATGATLLVASFGFSAVGASLLVVRWSGFLTICAYHLGLIALCGIAWSALVPKPRRNADFVWGRLLRDAGSEVLPLSQLGGYALGARALALRGVTGALAVASTIVDVTLELSAQIAYTGLGLGLLLWQRPDTEFARPVAFGLAAALALTIGFIVAQRRGLGPTARLVQRVAGRWLGPAGDVEGLHDAVGAIYRRGCGLSLGFLLHVAGWLAGAVEAWLALHLMGLKIDLGAAIAIESLLYAIRSVAFLVPNALGVQEGGYVMLGTLFGLNPEAALALSLLKRARDIALGVPILLAWQFVEGNRLLRQRPADRQAAP